MTDLDNAREALDAQKEKAGPYPSVADLLVESEIADTLISTLESELARVTKERDEARVALTQAIGLVEAWRPSSRDCERNIHD